MRRRLFYLIIALTLSLAAVVCDTGTGADDGEELPGAPTLIHPDDGATDVELRPTFQWRTPTSPVPLTPIALEGSRATVLPRPLWRVSVTLDRLNHESSGTTMKRRIQPAHLLNRPRPAVVFTSRSTMIPSSTAQSSISRRLPSIIINQ